MSVVNQLLAKAMSTASEEEAISCIRMARKKGGTFDGNTDSTDFNGHDAKYWYEKAAHYYNEAKQSKLNSQGDKHGLSKDQQRRLFDLYKSEEAENKSLRSRISKLEAEKRLFDTKLSIARSTTGVAFVAGAILMLFVTVMI